jgi:lipopolysaccharide export system permease protein
MIFHKALVREFANTALATFVVLVGIALTSQLIRLLRQAASGLITTTDVALLLGFSLLYQVPVLLSLTAFMSVLMTLTRSYRDSEMVVWFASGVGLTQWIRPVLVFALPLVFTVALLSLVFSPWVTSKADDLRRMMDNRDELAAVIPGVFRESKRADRVYFVEAVSGSANTVANVFVSSAQHRKLGVMVARRGYQETAENGDRFLVLTNGRRYEGVPGTAEYRVYQFDRYAMRVEMGGARVLPPTTKVVPTLDLLRSPSPLYLGELAWRVGLPVSALILTLLAVPLSFVNPRAGRSLNLVLALVIYMTYSNLLSIAQIWVAQSRLSFGAALAVHVVMFALLLLLFHRRLAVSSLFRFLK